MSKITQMNLVEILAMSDDLDDEGGCAFDQPCVYGHRVGYHAVYCHHPDGIARKCYYRFSTEKSDYEQNECGGYTPNPDYKWPA